LIPQRNISLLSNRLAAGGGLRIREDVLERDYCLAWFLNALAESDLRPILAFNGGTALKPTLLSFSGSTLWLAAVVYNLTCRLA
jgi:predicted nucleotidyltransferase component of viral defense system